MRLTVPVSRNLARQDVAKERKCIVEGLVVDALVQVLDIDVASSTFAKAWITLAPHDAACAALDAGVIQCVKGTLGIPNRVEVDIALDASLRENTRNHWTRLNLNPFT